MRWYVFLVGCLALNASCSVMSNSRLHRKTVSLAPSTGDPQRVEKQTSPVGTASLTGEVQRDGIRVQAVQAAECTDFLRQDIVATVTIANYVPQPALGWFDAAVAAGLGSVGTYALANGWVVQNGDGTSSDKGSTMGALCLGSAAGFLASAVYTAIVSIDTSEEENREEQKPIADSKHPCHPKSFAGTEITAALGSFRQTAILDADNRVTLPLDANTVAQAWQDPVIHLQHPATDSSLALDLTSNPDLRRVAFESARGALTQAVQTHDTRLLNSAGGCPLLLKRYADLGEACHDLERAQVEWAQVDEARRVQQAVDVVLQKVGAKRIQAAPAFAGQDPVHALIEPRASADWTTSFRWGEAVPVVGQLGAWYAVEASPPAYVGWVRREQVVTKYLLSKALRAEAARLQQEHNPNALESFLTLASNTAPDPRDAKWAEEELARFQTQQEREIRNAEAARLRALAAKMKTVASYLDRVVGSRLPFCLENIEDGLKAVASEQFGKPVGIAGVRYYNQSPMMLRFMMLQKLVEENTAAEGEDAWFAKKQLWKSWCPLFTDEVARKVSEISFDD